MSAKSPPVLLQIYSYAKEFRPKIILASLYSVLNKIFDIAPEILIGFAIDLVVKREKSFFSKLGIEDVTHQLILLSVLTFFVWGFESVFEYLYKLEWRNLAQKIQHKMRLDGYKNAQDLDLQFFESQNTGNLTTILNDDINQLERFLDLGVNQIIQVLTTVVVIGTLFFVISPLIAIFAFAPIPVIIFGAFWFQKRAQPLYAEVRNNAGLIAARLNNNLSGIATIKSFTAEEGELKNLTGDSLRYMDSNKQAILISSAFVPIIRMAILAGFLTTLVLGGWMTLDGQLEVGFYGVLVFMTQRLLWPLTGLAEVFDTYERAMASARRILKLIFEKPTIVSPANARKLSFTNDIKIEYKGVSFGYASSVGPVLKEISFTVSKGQSIAFVGPTGSGKSTIIKLLLRFYEADEGLICINGHNINEYDLGDLRRSIGLVSQDIFLFEGTVKENINYGRVGSSDEEVHKAAQYTEADGFINQLNDGYETRVGERGQRLSGGQRQRIALARTFLKDPEIVILDEATSAVDNETERAIQKSIRHFNRDKTLLIIAHRLSTIIDCDKIFVIEDGQVTESGNHQELIKKHGTYQRLWSLQTGHRGSEGLSLQ